MGVPQEGPSGGVRLHEGAAGRILQETEIEEKLRQSWLSVQGRQVREQAEREEREEVQMCQVEQGCLLQRSRMRDARQEVYRQIHWMVGVNRDAWQTTIFFCRHKCKITRDWFFVHDFRDNMYMYKSNFPAAQPIR